MLERWVFDLVFGTHRDDGCFFVLFMAILNGGYENENTCENAAERGIGDAAALEQAHRTFPADP